MKHIKLVLSHIKQLSAQPTAFIEIGTIGQQDSPKSDTTSSDEAIAEPKAKKESLKTESLDKVAKDINPPTVVKPEQSGETEPLGKQVVTIADIFYEFNYSVIAGEYYDSSFESILDEIKGTLKNLPDTSQWREVRYFFDSYKGIFLYINRYLKNYLNPPQDDKISYQRYISSFSVNEIREYIDTKIRGKSNIVHAPLHSIFQINLFLSLIDFDLNCSNETIEQIIEIKEFLEAEDVFSQEIEFKKILLDKCWFLLIKTVHKIKGSFYYATHNKIYENLNYRWAENEAKNITDSYYQYFVDLFNDFVVNKDILNYKIVPKENSFLKIYKSLKTLKKTEREDSIKEKLLSLINEVNLVIGEESDFDKISKYSVIAHINRQIFFFECKCICDKLVSNQLSPEQGFYQLKKLLIEIENTLVQYHIRDSKIYDEFIAHILRITKYLREKTSKIKLDELIEFNEYVLKCFDKYRDCYEWMEKFDYMPVIMPYNECLHDHLKDNQTIRLFLDSSFYRPQNIEKIKANYSLQFDQFRKDRVYLVAKVVYAESLRETEEYIQDAQNKTEQSIDKNQIKNIEVLSIFTAAIALIISAVVVSTKELQWNTIIYWMMGLTLTMATFVILIHSIISDKIKWGVIIVFAILYFVFLEIMLVYKP